MNPEWNIYYYHQTMMNQRERQLRTWAVSGRLCSGVNKLLI